jgi:TolB-like protein
VLAFTNMSGDPDQEYLSDGFADSIITELSRGYFPGRATTCHAEVAGKSERMGGVATSTLALV